MEWKEVRLGDVCSELSDGLHKAPKFIVNGEYIFVNAKNLYNGYILDNDPTKKTSHEEYLKYKKPLGKHTILYSIDGTIGNIAKYRGEKCVLGKGACYINCNPEIVESSYLYYQLQSPHFKSYIHLMSTGSTIKHISLKTMRDYVFELPSLDDQRRIASILSSLDRKIELNNKINADLEEMAQAIFKNWFVDFEPFKDGKFVDSELGMIPEGWKVVKLGDFFPVKTGKKDANTASVNGKYPFFSCSQNALCTDSYSFDCDAILVAGNGDFNVKWYSGKFDAYQRTYVLIPYNKKLLALLYYVVKRNLLTITSKARGSVIRFITKGNLTDFEFAIPRDLENNEIVDVFKSINEEIFKNNKENSRLSLLRDTLLPRLMSGELEVPE